MIQERHHGPWKPDQQKRGTGMEKNGGGGGKTEEREGWRKLDKKKNTVVIRCGGTLHVIF
jgi:hypothetical protein